MENTCNDEIEIDLKELLYVLKKRWQLILKIAVLGAVLLGGYSKLVLKPVYTSSTMLYILNKETTLTSLTNLQLGIQLTNDYKGLIVSRPVVERVIENLELGVSYESLVKMVTISNPTDTRIITITVNSYSPQMAKAIADELAKVSTKRISEIMETDPPKVVEEAYVPENKTSPSFRKYVMLGGGAGGFLAVLVIGLLFLLNDNIKNSDDVERYLGLSTLGEIPIAQSERNEMLRKRRRWWQWNQKSN